MRRLLVVIVGILATSLGTIAPAMAAAQVTTCLEVIHVYAYNDQYSTAPFWGSCRIVSGQERCSHAEKV